VKVGLINRVTLWGGVRADYETAIYNRSLLMAETQILLSVCPEV
jgi:hypothetical protein